MSLWNKAIFFRFFCPKLVGFLFACYTANEGPVRIQYKCLVPFMYSQKLNCAAFLFPKQNYNVLSPNPTLIYLLEIYIFPEWSDYFAAAKYVDRSREYRNRSETYECRNWDWGRAIPFLGIHKFDFWYSAE